MTNPLRPRAIIETAETRRRLDIVRKIPYIAPGGVERTKMAAIIEETSTITAKGQTTIPKAVRQALGVDYGGKIAYRIEEGRVTVHNPRGRASRSGAGGVSRAYREGPHGRS